MPRPKPKPSATQDALIAAVIAKLPMVGDSFAAAERESWFELARNAFDCAYGKVERSPLMVDVGSVGGPAMYSVRAAAKPQPDAHYHIAPDGFAMRDATAIDPEDIPPGTVVHDYRGQPVSEFDPVMWATLGAKLGWTLPPGVVIRAATGPMPKTGGVMT